MWWCSEAFKNIQTKFCWDRMTNNNFIAVSNICQPKTYRKCVKFNIWFHAGHCVSIMSIREHNYNKYIRGPEYSHPNTIESHIIRWTILHVRSCSTSATAFSGRSFQPWVISALSRFCLGRLGLSRFGPGSFWPNLVGKCRLGYVIKGSVRWVHVCRLRWREWDRWGRYSM